MKILDEAAIRAAIKEPEALVAAEAAFQALGADAVNLPPPMGLHLSDADGEVHVKSAHLDGSPVFAVKIASGFYRNVDRGLPSGAGLILVFDAETGFPAALLQDNAYLTDLRTAAAGALAARLLSSQQLEVVAVLGSGIQARYQLRALTGVRRWSKTTAWSPNSDRLSAYCREMQDELGLAFTAAKSPDDAVRDADLVITATPSREPLIDAGSLLPHATVIAVGSDGPDKRELPTAALARADKIVVDRLSQCAALGELHHAIEDGVLTLDSVHAELGHILLGHKPGREADELIVCDLTGVGAQDAAIAEAAWLKLV